MRRTVTLQTMLHALIAAPVLPAAMLSLAAMLPLAATLPLPAAAEEAQPVISIVTGLAPDDLLNVRAAASAIGKTETRLAAGASVRNLGCNDFNGYKWCKVEADNPKATGWAPARYLLPLNPAPVPDTEIATQTPPATDAAASDGKPGENNAGEPPAAGATQANASPSGDTKPAGDDGAPPVRANAAPAPEAKADANPAPAAVDKPDSSASADAAPKPAPAHDLAARLGGTDGAQPWTPKSPAEIGRAAMQDAYGLAFAAQENQAVQSTQDQPATDKPQQGAMVEPADATDAGSSAGGIPVPTPRPARQGDAAAPALDPQTVARVDPSPGRAPDATAEIPCARYLGQPMARCQASVQRNGTGKSDVTVTWPDAGTRVISFYDGQPAGSNSRSDFRFTREGNLNMIRVGAAERFEITDSIAFGD